MGTEASHRVHRRRVPAPPPQPQRGFTLLEIVVVLVVMGLTAALAVPALRPPREPTATLRATVRHAQALALRRGETMRLEVSREGRWTVSGMSSAADGVLARGRLVELDPPGDLTLRISPTGSCAWSLNAAWRPRLEPLTCRIETE